MHMVSEVISDDPLPTIAWLAPSSSIIRFIPPACVLEWCAQFRLRLCDGAFAGRVALSLEGLPYKLPFMSLWYRSREHCTWPFKLLLIHGAKIDIQNNIHNVMHNKLVLFFLCDIYRLVVGLPFTWPLSLAMMMSSSSFSMEEPGLTYQTRYSTGWLAVHGIGINYYAGPLMHIIN